MKKFVRGNAGSAAGASVLPSQRHLFDIPEEVAYFNSAYVSPQLNESRARLLSAAQEKSRPWDRVAPDFFDDAETIRELCARIFGGDTNGYAVVPAASYGLSAAARALEPQLKSGDRILVVAEEFPSNVLPWKRVGLKSKDIHISQRGDAARFAPHMHTSGRDVVRLLEALDDLSRRSASRSMQAYRAPTGLVVSHV
jgi:kynureninase